MLLCAVKYHSKWNLLYSELKMFATKLESVEETS